MVYSCQDRPSIWISSGTVRDRKCSYSYLKQKQSQKEGASCALLALQPAFLHRSPSTSESGEQLIRGGMKSCLLQRLTPSEVHADKQQTPHDTAISCLW